MDDLISRQQAIDAIGKLADEIYRTVEKGATFPTQAWFDGMAQAEHIVKNLPPAQPETAKRIVGKSRDGMTLWYQCDMCNEPVDAQDNFCSGCGRRFEHGSD